MRFRALHTSSQAPARAASIWGLAVLSLAWILPFAAAAAPTGDVTLFPYFTAQSTNSVFLMWSPDGLEFQHVNGGQPILSVADGVTRDPSIARGPDGRFHMVWTSGAKEIGYASSPDLVSWSAPRSIAVWGAGDNVINAWAPELFYDESEQEFLILWASTDRDRFPTTGSSEIGPDGIPMEHRLYAATTTDFVTLTDTQLFFDPGFNVIDGMIAHDVAGDRYVMAFKDERAFYPEIHKNIKLAFSDSAQGAYGDVTGSLTGGGANFVEWAEGATLLRFEDRWRLYFDTYLTESPAYNALESADLETWTNITDQLAFPEIDGRLQHGTLFHAPAGSVGWLVPEPAPGMLLGCALVAVAVRRRRRDPTPAPKARVPGARRSRPRR